LIEEHGVCLSLGFLYTII